jgi:hypothetical protein
MKTKKMKPVYLGLLIILLVSSCALRYRTTRITADSTPLGSSKEFVVNKFGKPFKTDVYMEDKKRVETIYYKEAVDVSVHTYILTSIFRFEDSILIKFEQKEESTPDVPNIKLQSQE